MPSSIERVKAPEILRLDNVRRLFPVDRLFPWGRRQSSVHAVDGVSMEVREHETVSLVGESGCGKTTTTKLVLRLDRPTHGRVLWKGQDLASLDGAALRRYRASVQAVFQDPWSSLNPRMRARDIVAEPLRLNSTVTRAEAYERVEDMFRAVGLDPDTMQNLPHEFSGGMRQRVAVARALILRPSIVVLDEPVSALDVSIRAQIMNLLKDLQLEFGMAYLLVAHNLATVRYLSDRVLVMYLGRTMEYSDSEDLFREPLHPYTYALIDASFPVKPGEGGSDSELILRGEVPSSIDPPSGCRFQTRCWLWERLGRPERCRTEEPELRRFSPGHYAACHFAEESHSAVHGRALSA